MRAIDTTTRSRKFEKAHPTRLHAHSVIEIATASNRSTQTIKNVISQAEAKFRKVWQEHEASGWAELSSPQSTNKMEAA